MNRPQEQLVQSRAGSLRLRRLRSIQEMLPLLELQREIWGYGGPGADLPVPPRALFALSESGGHVGVALLGERPIGFSLAWTGRDEQRRQAHLHSQMVGVHPQHRHLNVGFHLKLQQRDFALEQGLQLIRWTFDPLRGANANLNLRKLGAVVLSYAPDYYGVIQSPVSEGLPTDRVWAEWHVSSPRVEARLAGRDRSPVRLPDIPLITRLEEEGKIQMRRLVAHQLERREAQLLMEVPPDLDCLRQQRPAAAREWQTQFRILFQHYLERGYLVADFLFLPKRRRGFYLLSRTPLAELLAGKT